MMQFIRSQVAGIFAKLLFLLLIASFAVWGIGDIFTGDRGGQAVIEIDEIRFTEVEVYNQYQRSRSSLRLGSDLPDELASTLIQQVTDSLVEEGLYQAEAANMGIIITDAMVAEQIRQTASFKDQFGNFDPNIFQRALLNAGLDEAIYIRALKTELLRQQIADAVIAGVRMPSPLTKALFAYHEERRTAQVVKITTADQNVSTPSDAKLQEFYNARQEEFKSPDYRSVTYLQLKPEDFADEIAVTEVELEETYQDQLDQFTTPPTRTVDQALFDSLDNAKAAAKRIAEGGDFENTANDVAGNSTTYLSLGEIIPSDLPEVAQTPVFALALNAVSQPIETAFGWHLFKVTAITAGSVKPLTEVKAQIKREIQMSRALDTLFELANGLEDLLAGGATIEEAASELNLRPQSIAAIDPTGQDSTGRPVGDIDKRFIDTVFATETGTQSALIEDQQNSYFVLRVDGVTPAAVQPLSSVKQAVTEAWTATAKADAARALGEKIIAAVKAGQSLQQVADANNLSVDTLRAFNRQGDALPSGLPGDLPNLAFELTGTQIDQTEDDDSVAVLQLVSVIPANSDKNKDTLEALSANLMAKISRDTLDLYVASLRSNHNVRINRRVIEDSILGQDANQGSAGN
jgi:peptidyl-prolyl cis-trans isomerase D